MPLIRLTDAWENQAFCREIAGQIPEAQNQRSQVLSLPLDPISGGREFEKEDLQKCKRKRTL